MTRAAGVPSARGPRRRWSGGALLLATAAMLAACATSPDGGAVYRQYAAAAIEAGKFRIDLAPQDAPYDDAVLVRNFERVIFQPEAFRVSRDPTLTSESLQLKKWLSPIRYAFIGDAVTLADREVVEQLVVRLAGTTQLDIAPTSDWETANLLIVVLSPSARTDLATDLSATAPEYRNTLLGTWIHGLDTPCIALISSTLGAREDASFAPAQGGEITRGLIYMKGELEGLFRAACLHEEFSQTLGATEDHPQIRPSIFNDDQEFALLTRHDGELLRILYDPRLRPGMSRDQAMPIVREIVRDRGGRVAPLPASED